MLNLEKEENADDRLDEYYQREAQYQEVRR
jgi:hypothetical protein